VISICSHASPSGLRFFFLLAFLNKVGAILISVLPFAQEDNQNWAVLPSPI
jgi:hypothetical protein